MQVAIGADHNGLELKSVLTALLRELGHRVDDVGARTYDAHDDYPDYAGAVAQRVAAAAERGVIVCGSGVGACVTANKIKGVRASVCHDTYSARQGVEHDDMNVLCLGSRIVGEELAKEVVAAFMEAKFTDEPRHRRRLNKVLALEAGWENGGLRGGAPLRESESLP